MKTLADRAALLLARAGYRIDIDTGLFGGTAYRAALAEQAAHPAPPPPAGQARRTRWPPDPRRPRPIGAGPTLPRSPPSLTTPTAHPRPSPPTANLAWSPPCSAATCAP